MSVLRIGTRGSTLALTQTGMVADDLADATGATTELVTITTDGDRSNEPLSRAGGTGLFTGALRDALVDGRCDVVVHSLKDLPTAPHDQLVVAAIDGDARPPALGIGDLEPVAKLAEDPERFLVEIQRVFVVALPLQDGHGLKEGITACCRARRHAKKPFEPLPPFSQIAT